MYKTTSRDTVLNAMRDFRAQGWKPIRNTSDGILLAMGARCAVAHVASFLISNVSVILRYDLRERGCPVANIKAQMWQKAEKENASAAMMQQDAVLESMLLGDVWHACKVLGVDVTLTVAQWTSACGYAEKKLHILQQLAMAVSEFHESSLEMLDVVNTRSLPMTRKPEEKREMMSWPLRN